MVRPRGFLILSFVIGWLAIAGFLHFTLYLSSNPFQIGWPQGMCTLLYGSTALVAAVGLFKFKPWVHFAVDAWIAAVLLTCIGYVAESPEVYMHKSVFPGLVAFAIPLILLSWYVHKKRPVKAGPVWEGEGK